MDSHYRNKTMYNFDYVTEISLKHSSIYANQLYRTCLEWRASLGLESFKLKVLHVRNVDEQLLFQIELAEPMDQSGALERLVKLTSDRHEIVGISLKIRRPESVEHLYGQERITDLLEIPDAGTLRIPTTIRSFSTVNPSTMAETYRWFRDQIPKSHRVIVIGRDVIRPAYWLRNTGTERVEGHSECPVILEDSELALELNRSDLLAPEFKKFDTGSELENEAMGVSVIYNGRSFDRECAAWLRRNQAGISQLLIMTCKDSLIPKRLDPMWHEIARHSVDQQPETKIIQRLITYSC